MQSSLTGYILMGENVPMKDKETGKDITMVKITMLDEVDGTTRTDWVTPEKPKGFNTKLISKIVGPRITANYKQTNYDGVQKTVLDQISQAD